MEKIKTDKKQKTRRDKERHVRNKGQEMKRKVEI